MAPRRRAKGAAPRKAAMTPPDLPTPNDMVEHPELVALAARGYTLDLSLRSLLAAYPELGDPERGYGSPPPSECMRLAARLILHGRAEARLLGRYWAAIERERPQPPPDTDPLF
jgi:hypothetical protein